VLYPTERVQFDMLHFLQLHGRHMVVTHAQAQTRLFVGAAKGGKHWMADSAGAVYATKWGIIGRNVSMVGAALCDSPKIHAD
jgi:hypothetical protein